MQENQVLYRAGCQIFLIILHINGENLENTDKRIYLFVKPFFLTILEMMWERS